ncbi:hypothetical protein Pint_05135 [Pistacia integerrima]|uniref:Uncharacterized protein n=1 Tax=Pistacia integerrima TaxID=434235 RepID=A0ACC0ZA29_9ROSI|nr:hypothetical protein Pint_05135 [Pistacia integerrima]
MLVMSLRTNLHTGGENLFVGKLKPALGKPNNCMAPNKVYCIVILLYFVCGAASVSNRNQKAKLVVNASEGRPIPQTSFEIFFEVVYC